MRYTLLLMTLALVSSKPTTPKRIYTIGGWNQRGTAEKFLRDWSPFFVDYLTSTVVPLYDPPISFQLIPIDWEENSAAEVLIPKGDLDFICKYVSHSDLHVYYLCVTIQMRNVGDLPASRANTTIRLLLHSIHMGQTNHTLRLGLWSTLSNQIQKLEIYQILKEKDLELGITFLQARTNLASRSFFFIGCKVHELLRFSA